MRSRFFCRRSSAHHMSNATIPLCMVFILHVILSSYNLPRTTGLDSGHTTWSSFMSARAKAPSTPAIVSKQQATSSKQRSTLSKQHLTLLPQMAAMSNDTIVKFRPFDNVERTKFRSTLLPKPATFLPKTATMSKQHSTLSKKPLNL